MGLFVVGECMGGVECLETAFALHGTIFLYVNFIPGMDLHIVRWSMGSETAQHVALL